jgi:hypothetical protein
MANARLVIKFHSRHNFAIGIPQAHFVLSIHDQGLIRTPDLQTQLSEWPVQVAEMLPLENRLMELRSDPF